MSRHRDWDIACKIYIGNLGNNASKYEIEDAFGKYGPLKNVWVARNPPGFAFVEFEDPKGQLISKCPYGVIVSTKIPTKFFKDFCPSL
jgi:hypothetical protein